MGLFGRPARLEEEEALVQEQYEDIPTLPEAPSSTVIAAGATVTGTLRGEGIIQVEGTVEGEIDLQGAVIVASTGMVKGPVTADVIRMASRALSPPRSVCCCRRPAVSRATFPPPFWRWRRADGSTAAAPCPPGNIVHTDRQSGPGSSPGPLCVFSPKPAPGECRTPPPPSAPPEPPAHSEAPPAGGYRPWCPHRTRPRRRTRRR